MAENVLGQGRMYKNENVARRILTERLLLFDFLVRGIVDIVDPRALSERSSTSFHCLQRCHQQLVGYLIMKDL